MITLIEKNELKIIPWDKIEIMNAKLVEKPE